MRSINPVFLAVLTLAVFGCDGSMPKVGLPTLGTAACSSERLAFVEGETSRLFADFLDAQAQCLRRTTGERDYCDTWVDYQGLQREIRAAVIQGNNVTCLLPQPYDSDLRLQPQVYDRSTSPLRVLDSAFAKAGISPYDS